MMRKIRALGIAVAATLALSAALASGAQAEPGQLLPNEFPAFVTGQQQGGVTFDIGAGPLKTVTCESKLDATLEAAGSPVTFRPTYANCIAQPEAMPTTVVMNGCDYRFAFSEPGSTGAPESTGTIQAAIACPDGLIEIHVYENAMDHAANEPLCTYDIAPEGPVLGGIYHNVQGMPDYVTATFQAGFTAKSTIGPAMVCGGNMFNQHLPITLTGDYTIKAFEDVNGVEGELVDLHVG